MLLNSEMLVYVNSVIFASYYAEFTPSRGSTPVHHSFIMGTPKINKASLEDRLPGATPEPSPGKKKRLSELFEESLREEMEEKQNTDTANGKPRIVDVSASATPYLSGTSSICSSERTANGDALIEREKSTKSGQCCLPSLISCRSFSEKKKMSPAPAIAVNDEA